MKSRNTWSGADQKGFALVAVLVAVAVLSIMAASMLSSTRIGYQLAHYSQSRTELNALAEAGIYRGILALLDRRPGHRWRADGTPYTVALAGGKVTVRIQDELGKIDLNQASRELLEGLLSSAGVDGAQTDKLVDRILDWRTSTNLRRLNGAADDDYRATGLAYIPRHGPFQSMDELRLVLGMDDKLFNRIEPALTIYSGRPFLDPQVAPREALLALDHMDASQADNMIKARATPASAGAKTGGSALRTITTGISTGGRAFSIEATATASDGTTVTLTAAIRLTGDQNQPYWVLYWHAG